MRRAVSFAMPGEYPRKGSESWRKSGGFQGIPRSRRVRGMNMKAVAEYVGTSVAMIENDYGRFISDRRLGP
jgi:hypothetical protein